MKKSLRDGGLSLWWLLCATNSNSWGSMRSSTLGLAPIVVNFHRQCVEVLRPSGQVARYASRSRMLLKRSLTRPVLRTSSWRCTNQAHVRLFDSNNSTGRPSAVITTDPSYTPLAFPPAVDKRENLHFAWLKSRSLIRLTGPDVFPFLQGVITANITRFELPSAAVRPIYTTFLNAQGRILNDVFLWRGNARGESEDAPWLIDVDTASRGNLLAHLKKHKLRSKVKLENVSDEELRVYQGWINEYNYAPNKGENGSGAQGIEGHHEVGSSKKGLSPHPAWTLDKGISMTDPRPGMGMRWLGTAEETLHDALRHAAGYEPSTYPAPSLVPEDQYMIHRMLHGIAEGQNEIIGGSALPQESNMDFFGGIDFRKGCYLGQELTIRTHHTGVVRKRILPVQLEKDYAPIVPGSIGPYIRRRSTRSCA